MLFAMSDKKSDFQPFIRNTLNELFDGSEGESFGEFAKRFSIVASTISGLMNWRPGAKDKKKRRAGSLKTAIMLAEDTGIPLSKWVSPELYKTLVSTIPIKDVLDGQKAAFPIDPMEGLPGGFWPVRKEKTKRPGKVMLSGLEIEGRPERYRYIIASVALGKWDVLSRDILIIDTNPSEFIGQVVYSDESGIQMAVLYPAEKGTVWLSPDGPEMLAPKSPKILGTVKKVIRHLPKGRTSKRTQDQSE